MSYQTQLLGGAALDAGGSYSGAVAMRPGAPAAVASGGQAAARMWPRNSGYAPFSSSAALEAARRRTQDLYNARRSQLGSQTAAADSAPLPPANQPAFLPPSPPQSGFNIDQLLHTDIRNFND